MARPGPEAATDVDYDVIVIGGGINGAGIARDAAMRGLEVLLLESADFGSGTSSWSSRLIHGGLRYLEYGEFPLVFESLRLTVNNMHCNHHALGHRRGGGQPLRVQEMDGPRRAATTELLGAVKYLLGSRQEPRAPTGGSALNQVLKAQRLEYSPQVDNTYVDFLADEIAETKFVDQTVQDLEHLPTDMAAFYPSEAKVLDGCEDRPEVLADLDRRYCRAIGRHEEGRKYNQRKYITPMWA